MVMDSVLREALTRASKDKLTRVIVGVCYASPECLKEVRSRLVKRPLEPASSDEPSAKKQKVVETSRYVLCAQYKDEYDTDYNEPSSCEKHPGELEMDEDAFPDDDEIEYGPGIAIPGDWRVTSFPDYFTWSCCEGDADAEPCRKGRHSDVNNDDGYPGTSSGEESEEEDEEDESEDEPVVEE